MLVQVVHLLFRFAADAFALLVVGASRVVADFLTEGDGLAFLVGKHRQEAAALAKEAAVKELWLTHYSPAMTHPKDYQDEVKAIFENTVIAKDGELKVLNFEEA